jgi:hypothetical protein
VRPCGGDADEQLGGDLLVAESAADQGQHFSLAIGQDVERRARGHGRTRPIDELADEPAGDAGRQQRLARRHDLDRPDQLDRLDVLEEEAAGAGSQGIDDVLVELEGREDQHPDVVECGVSSDLAGRLDAVDLRHLDVHEHHLRPLRPGQLNRVATVGGHTDHLDTGLGVEQHAEAGAHQSAVVREGDANHSGSRARTR